MNFEQHKNENITTPEVKIKEGVDFVFEQNPELSKVGTKEQYSEYLDTIFPESKVKDIVYHTTNENFDVFNHNRVNPNGISYGKGSYFSKKIDSEFGEIVKVVLLNIKNPIYSVYNYIDTLDLNIITKLKNDKKVESIFEKAVVSYVQSQQNENLSKEDIDKVLNDKEVRQELDRLNIPLLYSLIENDDDKKYIDNILGLVNSYDSIIIPHLDWYVATNPEQIHILGSKQDIDKFKEFVTKSKSD